MDSFVIENFFAEADSEDSDSESETSLDMSSSDDSLLEALALTQCNKKVKITNFITDVVHRYSDEEFRRHFRVTRHTCKIITNLVSKAAIEERKTLDAVLIFLWYIANQETFRQISDRFDVTESTAYKIISKVSNILVANSAEFIKWPTEEDCVAIAQGFYKMKKFENVIGAIDGSHIEICRPKVNQSDYCNRKGYHSIVLQGVVDCHKKFIDVYCGEPGSLHDARILRKSQLYQNLGLEHRIYDKYQLLGDSAYPSLPWLLTPYKDNGHLTEDQNKYNYEHSSTRICVENAFGLLKGRFRRLRRFDNIKIDSIVRYIISACVIHNICIMHNDGGQDLED